MGSEENRRLGVQGERSFRQFADASGIPYLWVDQQPETMPGYLRALVYDRDRAGKRPDAVVRSVDGDVLLVDVKHRRLYAGRQNTSLEYFTLDKADAQRLEETERALGKRVLLVYKDNREREQQLVRSLALRCAA